MQEKLVEPLIPEDKRQLAGLGIEAAVGVGVEGLLSIAKAGLFANRGRVLKATQEALDDMTGTQKILGKEITDLMDSPVGEKVVNIEKTTAALGKLPQNVQNKILKQPELFKIEDLT